MFFKTPQALWLYFYLNHHYERKRNIYKCIKMKIFQLIYVLKQDSM